MNCVAADCAFAAPLRIASMKLPAILIRPDTWVQRMNRLGQTRILMRWF